MEWLPTSHRVDAASFAARRTIVLAAAVALLILLFIVALSVDEDLPHATAELTPMAAAIVYGWYTKVRLRSSLSLAFALMAGASHLVHFTDGLIEAHFLFFVVLPLVALFQDWRAFLGAIGYVVLHHGIIGTIAPEAVYNHQAAIAEPVKWGLIHGVFIVCLVAVLVVEWVFAEADQRLAGDRLDDLQAVQAGLVQAQKLESVGQLAAGVAHEINTPMQYIGDNTNFLKATVGRLLKIADAAQASVADGATEEDRAALVDVLATSKLPMLAERAPKAADDALSGVEIVSEIVSAMKRFSHPDSDQFEMVDVNSSITTTLTVCRNEWKYAADVATYLAEDLPRVEGRLGRLNQVWLNMIVNAAHAISDAHGDKKGLITISSGTSDDGKSVRLTIADNGTGIDPENISRIFDQFFTTKSVGTGTGQGLALAHQTVTSEHNGRVSVNSVLGEGTTFTVVLPIAQPKGSETPS